MLISDHLRHSGEKLFRWRSYVLLAFAPAFVYAAFQGEVVEHLLGATAGDAYEMLAIALVICGQVLRIVTVGHVPGRTSGRNTAGQLAEVLNTSGIYSLVRNPLYLGNSLMYLGLALFSQNIALAVILSLVLVPYYERIIAAEEAFLAQKFGQSYTDWAARTPAFLPRLTGYRAPALPFSIRSVLRREQASVYGALLALYLLETGLHHLGRDPEPMDTGWHWAILVGTLVFVLLKAMKKYTRLLVAEGR